MLARLLASGSLSLIRHLEYTFSTEEPKKAYEALRAKIPDQHALSIEWDDIKPEDQFWVLLGLVRQLVSNNTTVENFVRQIISRSTDPLGRDSFTVDRLGGDGAGKGYYLLHVETTHEWGLLSVAPDTADIPRYFPWNMDRENEAQKWELAASGTADAPAPLSDFLSALEAQQAESPNDSLRALTDALRSRALPLLAQAQESDELKKTLRMAAILQCFPPPPLQPPAALPVPPPAPAAQPPRSTSDFETGGEEGGGTDAPARVPKKKGRRTKAEVAAIRQRAYEEKMRQKAREEEELKALVEQEAAKSGGRKRRGAAVKFLVKMRDNQGEGGEEGEEGDEERGGKRRKRAVEEDEGSDSAEISESDEDESDEEDVDFDDDEEDGRKRRGRRRSTHARTRVTFAGTAPPGMKVAGAAGVVAGAARHPQAYNYPAQYAQQQGYQMAPQAYYDQNALQQMYRAYIVQQHAAAGQTVTPQQVPAATPQQLQQLQVWLLQQQAAQAQQMQAQQMQAQQMQAQQMQAQQMQAAQLQQLQAAQQQQLQAAQQQQLQVAQQQQQQQQQMMMSQHPHASHAHVQPHFMPVQGHAAHMAPNAHLGGPGGH